MVRVIPNKFAALSSDIQPTRSLQHLRRRIDGFGFHEVIIDSPDHSRYMALLPDDHVASILRVYKQRYQMLSTGPSGEPYHDFQESWDRCGSEHAASAFAVDCDADDSEPGAAPLVRGAAPL